LVVVCVSSIIVIGGTSQANWVETFDGGKFDLPTWQFHVYPNAVATHTEQIIPGPNGNDYLSLDETTAKPDGGVQFAGGFGSDEIFTDVRVGAVVNVVGDASRNYHGLTARTEYIVDDGSLTGFPGTFVALQVYVMHINWEDGPANLRIDIEKVVTMQNIMRNAEELRLDIYVPGLNRARSYYAELDVVGSDPVYVTGSLYEYKGGPLVARTATMVDTSGNDPWEDPDVGDAVFVSGTSGIFSQSEQLGEGDPIGYHCTFDDVFSVSDGPAAVNPSPANRDADVSVNVTLSWLEAEFATGRELWFGKAGAMEKVDPAPTGTTYTPGPLEFRQAYEWRVDQIGASGAVTGHTWTFTTAAYLTVDDFESYGSDADIQAAWPHNIQGVDYVFLAADGVGNKSMRLYYQNQYEPYFTEATRTFADPQDWTQLGVGALSLWLAGQVDNVEQRMYLKVEDVAGNGATVAHPDTHACQSRLWWTIALSEFSAGGVDLNQISKLTIGLGDGTKSGQADEDLDSIFVDNIRLYPAP
jgi:hypothetical protein